MSKIEKIKKEIAEKRVSREATDLVGMILTFQFGGVLLEATIHLVLLLLVAGTVFWLLGIYFTFPTLIIGSYLSTRYSKSVGKRFLLSSLLSSLAIIAVVILGLTQGWETGALLGTVGGTFLSFYLGYRIALSTHLN